MYKKQEKYICELLDDFDIGNVIGKPLEIKGGLLHKLYRVTTDKGEYAVKCLNSAIMKRECALNNMINSEKISAILGSEVSVIIAKEINGNQVHLYKDHYFMIFDWFEGVSVYPPDINEKHCRAIGNVLGKIHSLNITVKGLNLEDEIYQLSEWEKYLDRGQKENAMWVYDYEEAMEDIINWNHMVLEAKPLLSTNMVISHRDLDPKNVMWKENNPYLIDWEAAGYVNPYQELLEVLNYWADVGNGDINKNYFMALLNSYKAYKQINGVNWEAILSSGYEGMLGWLEYNLKRALGIELSSEDEIKLGQEQVIGTIKELKRYSKKSRILKEWL